MSKKFSIGDLLSNESKLESTNTFKIVNIELDKIIPSPKNNYGIRDIEELADNIQLVGLMHNIVVKKVKYHYEIISGERRYQAYKKLSESNTDKYTTIPCKVEESSNADDNETLSELKLLFANSQARELNDYEKMYQASRIKELLIELKEQGYKFPGRMREQIADMLKVSSAQVGRMESISNNLSDPLKEKFKGEEINITTAYEASRLDDDKQEEVLSKVEDDGVVTTKDIKKIKESVHGPPLAGSTPKVEFVITCGEKTFECHNKFEVPSIIRSLLSKKNFDQITIKGASD